MKSVRKILIISLNQSHFFIYWDCTIKKSINFNLVSVLDVVFINNLHTPLTQGSWYKRVQTKFKMSSPLKACVCSSKFNILNTHTRIGELGLYALLAWANSYDGINKNRLNCSILMSLNQIIITLQHRNIKLQLNFLWL